MTRTHVIATLVVSSYAALSSIAMGCRPQIANFRQPLKPQTDIKESNSTTVANGERNSGQKTEESSTTSPQSYDGLIAEKFRSELGRQPTNEELTSYAARLSRGEMNELQFVKSLRDTEEYKVNFTVQSDSLWIQEAYGAILGRQPSADEIRAWAIEIVRQGLNQTQFAATLKQSPEYVKLWLIGQYRAYLERDPSDTEVVSQFESLRSSGFNFDALRVGIETSFERRLLVASRTFPSIITAIYKDELKRAPGSNEITYWVNEVAKRDLTAQGLLDAIHLSDEYIRLWTKGLYSSYLGRLPSEAEYLQNIASAGQYGFNAVQNGIINSAEAVQFRVVNQHRPTIIALYGELLGRSPAEGEVVAWALAIYQQGLNLAQLRAAVISSVEYKARWIVGIYRGYLFRDPSAAEINQNIGAVNAYGFDAVFAGIVNSDERFVILQYQYYLGRTPDAYERGVWIGNIAQIGRAASATAIAYSPESCARNAFC